MKIGEKEIHVLFDHVGHGLNMKGNRLQGFEISCQGGNFIPANARIEGDQVILKKNLADDFIEIRYNFVACPEGNLTNSEGLTAIPFRKTQTD